MSQYIGTDIVEIDRIKRVQDRWGQRFLRRVYTQPELDRYGHRLQSLAARFACKEAVIKLLDAHRKGLSWRDIEILSYPGGKPFINLYGRAKIEADKLEIKEIAVSLAHSGNYAIATVISTK